MSNKILCLLTATSLSLVALSAQAANDPRQKAGYQQNYQGSGSNDQNRQAIKGLSILGGGPQKAEINSANSRAFNSTAAAVTAHSNHQKLEAEKVFNIGLGLMREGKYALAVNAVKVALNIRETYFASSDPAIPEVKEKLAEIYALDGKKREALEMYGSALASYAKFNGPGTAHRIRPLTAMGSIHLSESNYKGALDCYNQAYMLTQRSKGVGSPETMRLRLQLAAVNQAAKSYDLAASLYNECFDLQKKNEKLIDRDQLIPSLQNYATVLKELKRDDEAATIIARVKVLNGETPVAATENGVLPDTKPEADAKPPTEVTTTTGTTLPAK